MFIATGLLLPWVVEVSILASTRHTWYYKYLHCKLVTLLTVTYVSTLPLDLFYSLKQ